MTSSAPKRIKKESLSGDEAAADKGEAEAAEEVGSRILFKSLKS